METTGLYFAISVITAGFALGIAALFAALAQGNATARAVEGIARQPEASGKIMGALIAGLAFMESLVLYTLLISLLLLFANPFIKYIVG